MRRLIPCPTCGTLRLSTCPHCDGRPSRAPVAAALLLGLSMATGCVETTALYGAPAVDQDGDGYLEGEDCDDTDPDVFPDAEETPGDGIDSNCDGDDDT